MVRRPQYVMVATLLSLILLASGAVCAGEYDKGKALYNENCMICHGADGKGDGPAAAALSPAPKDFHRPEFWNQKDVDQTIMNQVKNGKGSMPAFKLKEEEIKEIIDYMSHAFKG